MGRIGHKQSRATNLTVLPDDHEIENNWAGEVPEAPDPGFPDRRAAAFQAYYENMPLRRSARPRGSDLRLYRRFAWGDLATFHMLDTRQYRDDQACGDGLKIDCAERLDPNRTITGAEQERWLLDGFHRSRARWDVLGQQVFFAQRDRDFTELQGFDMDSWDGYRASRDRITAAMGDSRVRNGVVLTGDVHRHWAAEIRENPDRPDSAGVGVELVATSVTSTGDGNENANARELAENPHITFFKNRRATSAPGSPRASCARTSASCRTSPPRAPRHRPRRPSSSRTGTRRCTRDEWRRPPGRLVCAMRY